MTHRPVVRYVSNRGDVRLSIGDPCHPGLSNFGPPSAKTIRKGVVTRRLKKVKVTLPKFAFMEGES